MSEPFLGEIRMIGFNFAPRGWALCEGQLLSISENSALFSILGTFYGGDGQNNFALPDLRSRGPVHYGTGPGLPRVRLGERSGFEETNLASLNIPSHNHELLASSEPADTSSPAASVIAKQRRLAPARFHPPAPSDDVTLAGSIEPSGGGEPHENRQPQLGLYFIIATEGLFPSRS